MTKASRIFRTALQILVGLAAGIPAAAYQLHLSAATTAEIGGIVGVGIMAVTIVHNVLEGTTIPTLGVNPALGSRQPIPLENLRQELVRALGALTSITNPPPSRP